MRNYLSLIIILLSMSGCRTGQNDASDALITNGVEINSTEYAEVVEIHHSFILQGGMAEKYCSAVFVSKRTLLTAAHCISQEQDRTFLKDPNTRFNGHRAKAGLSFPGKFAKMYQLDLAVLWFDSDVAPAFKAVGQTPKAGSHVIVVGFGKMDASAPGFSGAYIKRKGTNVIEDVKEGLISVVGVVKPSVNATPGIDSVGATGDSGSPLMSGDKVIGIDSFGRTTSKDKKTWYVDLSSETSKRLLCTALEKGASIEGLDKATCPKPVDLDKCTYDIKKGNPPKMSC